VTSDSASLLHLRGGKVPARAELVSAYIETHRYRTRTNGWLLWTW